MANGRVAVGANRALLERLGVGYDQSEEYAIAFVAAWKTGVHLAGERFFDVRSASVGEALDKNDLRPIGKRSGPPRGSVPVADLRRR